MDESLKRAESGVLGWIDRDITGPMADFQDPSQEWRRLFSELYGTFLLVIVAAGGGMMGEAFPNTITRTAAVVAPGLMVMGVIMFMGKVSGAHLNPAVTRLLAARRLPVAPGARIRRRAAHRRILGGALPTRGNQGVGEVRLDYPRAGTPVGRRT